MDCTTSGMSFLLRQYLQDVLVNILKIQIIAIHVKYLYFSSFYILSDYNQMVKWREIKPGRNLISYEDVFIISKLCVSCLSVYSMTDKNNGIWW